MKKKLLAAASMLALGGMVLATPASAYERWLRVHNKTGQAICEVYISNVGTDDWGPDLIGSCINHGRYRTIDPGWQQGYCRMDLKFVLADDTVIEDKSGLDICRAEDYYVR
jgi:hypothetical protein